MFPDISIDIVSILYNYLIIYYFIIANLDFKGQYF